VIKVKVSIFSFLREKLGWREKTVKLDCNRATLREVLYRFPDLKEIVMHGKLEGFIILVNGRNVRHLKMLDTELTDGDEVVVFPPGGGG